MSFHLTGAKRYHQDISKLLVNYEDENPKFDMYDKPYDRDHAVGKITTGRE